MTLLVTVGLFFGLAVAVYRFFAWLEERGRKPVVAKAEREAGDKASAAAADQYAKASAPELKGVPSTNDLPLPVAQRTLPRLPDAEANPLALALVAKAATASLYPPESVLRPKTIPVAADLADAPADQTPATEQDGVPTAVVAPPLQMPVFDSLPDALIPVRSEPSGEPDVLVPANDDGDVSQQAAQ